MSFMPKKWRPRKALGFPAKVLRNISAMLPFSKRASPSELPQQQQSLEALSLIASGFPDKWACVSCRQLHDARRKDTPKEPWRTPCPRGQSGLSRTCGSKTFLIGRQHVQLALKYGRIWKNHAQRRHLRKLMAPHRAKYSILSGSGRKIPVRYSAYPRLCARRYLLASTWAYSIKGGKETFDLVAPCEHNRYRIDTHGRPSNFTPQPGYFTLEEALEAASSQGGTWTYGRCSRCPTEIEVRVQPDKIVIRAFQDLGTEDSPLGGADGRRRTGGLGHALEIYTCYMEACRRERAEEAARRAAAAHRTSSTSDIAVIYVD
ncbi:hypothetical protein ACJ41O_014146 [Fusarium nematophilum]